MAPSQTESPTSARAERLASAAQLLAEPRPAEALALLADPPGDAAPTDPRLLLKRDLLRLQAHSLQATRAEHLAGAQGLLGSAQAQGFSDLEGEALCQLGGILNRLHMFREALAQYGSAEALARRTGQSALLWSVAAGVVRVLYDAELHQERIDYCERLLRDEQDMPTTLRLLLMNQLAGAYKWLGDQQRAREIYLEALALAEAAQAAGSPAGLSVLLVNLANSCAWTGHFDEGWRHLNRCAEITPLEASTDDRRLWFYQAQALLVWKGGDPAAALPLFERVVEIGRRHLQTRAGLIAGLTRLMEAAIEAGRHDRAVTASQELLELTQQRSREQSQMFGEAVASLVRSARLETEKLAAERQAGWLEARVAERTAELSSAMGRLQAEIEMRRATEAALQQAHDELDHRVRQRTAELEQAMQYLMQREKLAALGQMAAGVAHELNTPIGNARLAASLILEESDGFRGLLQAPALRRGQVEQFVSKIGENASMVDRSLDRAGHLIQRFKSLARPESAGHALADVDLAALVRDTVKMIRAGLDAGVHWAMELPGSLPARVDQEALTEVLGLLIDNAWTHGIAGRGSGQITVRLREAEPGWARLEIQDDGPGIAAAHLGRIFEPFFTTRLGQGGSGLGLHRAHSAVTELLHGALSVSSEPGQGACFQVKLPLNRAA